MTQGRPPLRNLELKLLRAASWGIALVPAGSGQGPLVQPLYRRVMAGRPRREAIARLRGGARFRLDLSDHIQAEAFLSRDYNPPLLRFIAARLPVGGTFFDVGAHVGLVSLTLAARGRGRGAAVHAFEPDPLNASSFRHNLDLNPGLDVTLNEVAVGEDVGRAMLLRSVSGGDRALGRISSDGLPAAAGDESERVEVGVITLDDYIARRGIERVDVLKLDVEGYEPAALAGCRRALAERRVGCVVSEINEAALRINDWTAATIHDALSGHGYRPAPIPPVGLRRLFPRSGDPVADVAFLPS